MSKARHVPNEREMDRWEHRKFGDWIKRGMLKPDGTLRVGKEFIRRRRGREPRELTIPEICAILR